VRFEVPVRGALLVVVLAALDAIDGCGFSVRADLRGVRFLTGDSPLTPRASKMSMSVFSSGGMKMLVYDVE
jgi:hypothetical protein